MVFLGWARMPYAMRGWNSTVGESLQTGDSNLHRQDSTDGYSSLSSSVEVLSVLQRSYALAKYKVVVFVLHSGNVGCL